MKKLVVAFFALCLAMVMSMPVYAADVQFSGSYYVWGWYADNNRLGDKDKFQGASDAWYNQRFRLQTVFQVAEGLKLTTRFDAMEGVWDGAEVEGATPGNKESNMDWDYSYLDFNLPVGGMRMQVGMVPSGLFGTAWCDGEYAEGRIKLYVPAGPVTLLGLIGKAAENDRGTLSVDQDYDKYGLAAFYKNDMMNAGFFWYYLRNAQERFMAGNPYTSYYHAPMAYAKANFGPLYLEAEINYFFGKDAEFYESSNATDIDREGWSFFLNGKYTMGPAYVGAQMGWHQGDDPDTTDKDEAAYPLNTDYNPCLILWNKDLVKWAGRGMGTYAYTGDNTTNAWIWQVYGGFSPMEKLSLFASFTYAYADQKPKVGGVSYVDDKYGYEFDLKGTYKLFDNLAYEVAFGYFWAGDYYKGIDDKNEVENNYLISHKLTLNF